jgi:hypothetical protein
MIRALPPKTVGADPAELIPASGILDAASGGFGFDFDAPIAPPDSRKGRV